MAEVIEINIISINKGLLLRFLDFIPLQMKERTVKRKIEVMDNWQYDNVETIDTIDALKRFIGSKIVCITDIGARGTAGIVIEPINGLLQYNIWFNSAQLSTEAEYYKLITAFIEYLSKSKILNDVIIGGIGKETKFEYFDNAKDIIDNTHNVNIWLIDKKELLGKMPENYKVVANLSSGSSKREIVVLSKVQYARSFL